MSWVLSGASSIGAEGWSLEQSGLRFGFPATRLHEHFYQVEAHARIDTPCQLALGHGWEARSGLDLSAGMLMRDENEGFVGTVGPVVSIRWGTFPVEFVSGSSATILSRNTFGRTRFGIPFQFTSHVGLGVSLARHWTASYRFQHMSNGSLSPRNPGLDLHSLGISYRF